MKTNKEKILRVNNEIHKKAKMCAISRMMFLHKWLEQLIDQEFKNMGLEK